MPMMYLASLFCLGLAVQCTQPYQTTTGTTRVPQKVPQANQNNADKIAFERIEIPEPNSISFAGKRYEARHWGMARGLQQNGGYIAIIDEDSGKEIAIIKIYHIAYDPELEADIQDVFISKLALTDKNKFLLIENERGDTYKLNLKDLSVRRAR
jgi:hypothetical protein